MMTGHVQGSGAVAPEVKAVPETVTAALDEFMEAFEAFKDVNDRRLGEIEQKLGGVAMTMRVGDSLHYSGATPHSWANRSAATARILWTGTLSVFHRSGGRLPRFREPDDRKEST